MFEEMQEQLSIARDVTRMQMSSKRNYYVQTNLVISIANLALLSCTITSGFFGGQPANGAGKEEGYHPLMIVGSSDPLSRDCRHESGVWLGDISRVVSIGRRGKSRGIITYLLRHLSFCGTAASTGRAGKHKAAGNDPQPRGESH